MILSIFQPQCRIEVSFPPQSTKKELAGRDGLPEGIEEQMSD
jgi:hypothetical protein